MAGVAGVCVAVGHALADLGDLVLVVLLVLLLLLVLVVLAVIAPAEVLRDLVLAGVLIRRSGRLVPKATISIPAN